MKRTIICKTLGGAFGALYLCFAATAQAQSSEFGSGFDRAYAPQATEGRIRFSIPLGESQNRSKTKPRLDFAIRNYNQSSGRQNDRMRANPNSFNQTEYSETRLGFTLESRPQWMLNDQLLQLPKGNAHANIGTTGKVGLGVAAVVAVVVVGGIIYLASGDCFLGEAGGEGCGT